MSRKTFLAMAAIVATVGAFIIGSCISAAESSPTVNEVAADEFVGKIVEIQTTTRKTFVLENVKVVQFGGQRFLSGMGIKKYRDLWWQGVPVRVNLSSVVSYFPMTPQQFERTIGMLDE